MKKMDLKRIDNCLNIVVIVCFLFVIFVPNMIMPIVNGFFGLGIGTNEDSYEMPELKKETVDDFPSDFDKWYGDNLPFRDAMGRAWAQFNYHILKDSTNDGVLFGEINGEKDSDRWLFYNNINDYSPVKDAQGLTDYSQIEMDGMVAMMKKNTKAAAKHGFELYYLVAPNKESVYREYLPDSVSFYDDYSRMDKFFKYANSVGISNLFYPKKELIMAKSLGQIYFKQDTHWNELGAGIAFKEVLKKIRSEWHYDFEYEFEQKKTEGDLAKMLKVSDYFTDQIVTIKHKSGSSGYNYDDYGDVSISHNSTAPINKKILIVGDSFRTNISEFFYRTFSDCMLLHRRAYKPEMLEEYDADVVILEFVERYAPAIIDFALYAE